MNAGSPTASQHERDGEGEGEAILVAGSRTGCKRGEGWIGDGAEGAVPIGVCAFLLGLVARRRLEFHARQRAAR